MSYYLNPRRIYILGSDWNSLVRIGHSVDPVSRLSSICAPFPTKLLWTSEAVPESTESHIHKACSEFRVYREWFDFKEEDPIQHVKAAMGDAEEKFQLDKARYAAYLVSSVEKRKRLALPEAIKKAREKRKTTMGAANWLGVSTSTFRAWEKALSESTQSQS